MKKRWTTLLYCLLFIVLFALPVTVSAGTPTVAYRTHIQNIGWEKGYKKNGKMSGTTHKALRLEAIQIKLQNKPYSGGIQYQTNIQNIGWEKGWKSNNKVSGSSHKHLRLEAIKIRLTGTMAKKYNIYYRVHAQNFGWLGWAKNGAPAGSASYSYRLEAIQIKLIPKGKSTAETRSKAKAFRQPPAAYKTIRSGQKAAFDFSGKGKKTSISMKASGGRISIFINNRKALTTRGAFGSATFLRLSNRRVYVFVDTDDVQMNVEKCLYKYNGSKLVPEYKFFTDLASPSSYPEKPAVWFRSISGNTVTFAVSVDSNAVGHTSSFIKLSYQNGIMRPQTRVVGVLNESLKKDTSYYKLAVNVPFYSSSKAAKKAGTLKAGTYYRVNAMYFKNGVKRFQLRGTNKRYYWISASASHGRYGTALAGRLRGVSNIA